MSVHGVCNDCDGHHCDQTACGAEKCKCFDEPAEKKAQETREKLERLHIAIEVALRLEQTEWNVEDRGPVFIVRYSGFYRMVGWKGGPEPSLVKIRGATSLFGNQREVPGVEDRLGLELYLTEQLLVRAAEYVVQREEDRRKGSLHVPVAPPLWVQEAEL